ncbi:MAG: DUF2934 domain-containing protein [Rhodospirillales bacterium]|nr:DUF2934 domain-containing protein [Rhodospirillales bacterium]
MDESVDERIRRLAQPLWESAAQPYGMAMDFWLMSEQMVVEMMSMTARMHNQAISRTVPPLAVRELPVEAPINRVRELAQCMWESAGRQYGMAQDFWLAAERHVLTMFRATAKVSPTASDPSWVAELAELPASAYLERIRVLAYYFWETAGQRYGDALDYWLQAEREVLDMMALSGERAAAQAMPAESAVPLDPQPLAPSAPATKPVSPEMKPKPKPKAKTAGNRAVPGAKKNSA